MKNPIIFTIIFFIVITLVIISIYYTIKKNLTISFKGFNSIDLSSISITDILTGDKIISSTIKLSINNNTPFSLTINNLKLECADNFGNKLFYLPVTNINSMPITINSNSITDVTLDVNIYASNETSLFVLNVFQKKQQKVNYNANFTIFGKEITLINSILIN